jgi:hypothetical protein
LFHLFGISGIAVVAGIVIILIIIFTVIIIVFVFVLVVVFIIVVLVLVIPAALVIGYVFPVNTLEIVVAGQGFDMMTELVPDGAPQLFLDPVI